MLSAPARQVPWVAASAGHIRFMHATQCNYMRAGAVVQAEEPVVICGFGPHGQMLAALLDRPLASLPDPRARAYIAFDLDPTRVQVRAERACSAAASIDRMAACLCLYGGRK